MDQPRQRPPSSGRQGPKKVLLPSLDVKDIGRFVQLSGPGGKGAVPNASLVYGVGAVGLFVMALYSLFTGAWFTAILLLLPAAALFGFALHFLKEDA